MDRTSPVFSSLADTCIQDMCPCCSSSKNPQRLGMQHAMGVTMRGFSRTLKLRPLGIALSCIRLVYASFRAKCVEEGIVIEGSVATKFTSAVLVPLGTAEPHCDRDVTSYYPGYKSSICRRQLNTIFESTSRI
jgi:hypothetical protein